MTQRRIADWLAQSRIVIFSTNTLPLGGNSRNACSTPPRRHADAFADD
jgi:hypothetical protein